MAEDRVESSENLPGAYFIIDPSLPEEDQIALTSLEQIMKTNPEFVRRSFDAYMADPEAADRMIALLGEHPEGLGMLINWQTIMRKRLDLEVGVDPITETIVEGDAYYNAARNDFQKTKDEKFRTQMRKRRISIISNRFKPAA